MQPITCILCHKPNSDIAITENSYNGARCADCSLIYINNPPTQETVANLYGHDQAYLSAATHIEHGYAKRLAARHTLAILSTYKTSGNLLEIGAGAGYFLDEARATGFTPYGIELNPRQATFIQNSLHIPCLQEPLSPTLFNGRRFDVIYHCDVISHFYDPIKEFHTMHHLLADDGILIFETGNLADVDPRYFNHIPAFQYPDHLFFFGERSLKQLLTLTGFELVALHTYSILPQLLLMKLTRQLKKQATAPQRTGESAKTRASGLKAIIKNGYHWGMHTVRYKIGKCVLQKKRPQTVIVVARKIK